MSGAMLRIGMAAVLLMAAVQSSQASESAWSMPTPGTNKVAFKGVLTMDELGKPAPMLYPAIGGAAGLVAALVTHGVIVNAQREGARSDAEKAADTVLNPFQQSLATFTERDLWQAAAGLYAHGEPEWLGAAQGGSSRVVASKPVFSLTQDRAALILDNEILIQLPGAKSPYASRVRVVSDTQVQPDLVSYWGSDGGQVLKSYSARLLASSIDIALDALDAPAPGTATQRTVRYKEGGKEVFERADILREDCERLLLRNLRGTLMSVPRLQRTGAACTVPAQ